VAAAPSGFRNGRSVSGAENAAFASSPNADAHDVTYLGLPSRDLHPANRAVGTQDIPQLREGEDHPVEALAGWSERWSWALASTTSR
jgi:hypothetical protein